MINILITVGIVIMLFLIWRFLFFFRNPKRKIDYNDQNILSPADGFVIYIKKVEPGNDIFSIKKGNKILLDDLMFIDDKALLHKPGWLIGISMSPFDIHYNRSPIRGFIKKIRHDFPTREKSNADMFPGLQNMFFNLKPYYSGCDYIIKNERASYLIKNESIKVYVTQIADNWIKKIVTYKENTTMKQGDVFGMIRMGSQVDVFIPDSQGFVQIQVRERNHVKAGITTLASIRSHDHVCYQK